MQEKTIDDLYIYIFKKYYYSYRKFVFMNIYAKSRSSWSELEYFFIRRDVRNITHDCILFFHQTLARTRGVRYSRYVPLGSDLFYSRLGFFFFFHRACIPVCVRVYSVLIFFSVFLHFTLLFIVCDRHSTNAQRVWIACIHYYCSYCVKSHCSDTIYCYCYCYFFDFRVTFNTFINNKIKTFQREQH